MSSFTIRRGESTIATAAPNPVVLTANGVAVDLTGATITARWRHAAGAPNEFEASTEVSPVVVDALAGKIALVLSAAQTAAFAVGSYLWLIKVTLASTQIIEFPLTMTVNEGY